MSEEDHTQVEDHIKKRFDLQDYKGKGAYGIVWKAFDRKTQQIVALKKVFDAFQNATDAQRTYREVVFLKQLTNHDNIIKLLSVIRAENNRDLYMVFEYMETDLHRVDQIYHMSLQQVIRAKLLTDLHIQYIAYQLIKTLKYIHSGELIHRDLKPANLLVNSSCQIKVADFGLARTLSQSENNDQNPIMTEYVATRWYRAPEILLGSNNYSRAIDLWSTGCIIGEMIIGKAIFPGNSTLSQIEKIIELIGKPSNDDLDDINSTMGTQIVESINCSKKFPFAQFFKGASENLLDFLRKLLVYSPRRRMTTEEALNHPYLKEFKGSEPEPLYDGVIQIPFNDSKKLQLKDYRDALYQGKISKKEKKQFYPHYARQFSANKKQQFSQYQQQQQSQNLSKSNTQKKSKSFHFGPSQEMEEQIPTVHKYSVYNPQEALIPTIQNSKEASVYNSRHQSRVNGYLSEDYKVDKNSKLQISKTPELSNYAGVNTPYRSKSSEKQSAVIYRSNSRKVNSSFNSDVVEAIYKQSTMQSLQKILQKAMNSQMMMRNSIYKPYKKQTRSHKKQATIPAAPTMPTNFSKTYIEKMLRSKSLKK